jgi:LmbE family N-acetylglucosaminyl deacetylase
MKNVAMAVAAHPDDIEFLMAGTLLELGRRGYEIHYMTVANGCYGTVSLERSEIAAIRGQEARNAAAIARAIYHGPLVDDLDIYYNPPLLARLGAVLREVNPRVLLVPSPLDYMEDHVNTSRLCVTAAFCRATRMVTDPPRPPVSGEMAVYHAMPNGLLDPLRNVVRPHLYVNIQGVMDVKHAMLACHQSQQQWLDESQGISSYLNAMHEMAERTGRQSGRWEVAEGWHRHLHLGFGAEAFDPLSEALGDLVLGVTQ